MKKRIIAFLLCFALVMPILPAFAVTTEDITLSATSVTLPQYEKKTITAAPGADVQVSAYQWQIKVPGTDLWVDISGANGATLELSYAMVASLLQGDQAQIRCEAVIGGETVETEVVTVTMDYTSEPAVVTASEPVKPQVLTQATVVESSVSVPASNAKQEETTNEGADLAALEEARNAAIAAESAAEAAVTAAQDKLTAAQTAEAAAKAALDQAQADYDAAVAAAAPAETEAEDAETTEAAPAVTVDSTARDAAKAAYVDAQNATAAAQKELDEAAAALTAAQAKTAEAQKAYEAEAKTANPILAAFGITKKTSNDAMLADASDEVTTQNFSIVINYVFADGTQAANPWTATLAAGSDYAATIVSPTIVGYAPDKAKVEVNVTGIAKDETITVNYVPAKVDYTVKHYLQNLNDDKYTLDSEETQKGYTESAVGEELEKDYEGFYSLLYDTSITIAADSSTEVEIYYDRYYYLMTFDLDGGYDVEPIYARYGAPVSAGTPTKAGYTFVGWKDEATDTVYSADKFPHETMPAGNTDYIAQWTSGNVTFDVVFWYENADDTHYSQAGVLYDIAATAGSRVNGSDYANTNFDGRDSEHFTYSHADQDVTVKGDGSTVVNVYFSRNIYTLTFEIDPDYCDVATHTHTDACKRLICEKTLHNHETNGCKLSCSHTTHALSCYSGEYNSDLQATQKPDYALTHIGNGIYTYKRTEYGYTRYVLNIGDIWYRSERGSEYEITLDCSHTHGDSCYNCGIASHAHGNSCYEVICGENEHYHSYGTCYVVVTRKYDADITDVWTTDPIDAVTEAGDAFEWNVTSAQVAFMEKMPGRDSTMTQYSYGGSRTYHWFYYLEVLPGQSTAGLTTITQNGKTYYQYDDRTIKYYDTLSLTYDDDYYPITGFTQLYSKGQGGWYKNDGNYCYDFTYDNSSKEYRAYLYYTRNSYTLTFSNNGTVVADEGGSFPYQDDISGTNFTPEYPDDLEPNAYVFEGWYESPFFGDTKFEFTSTGEDGNTVKTTMPAKDITLYARWVPVDHEVRLYPTVADMQANTNQIGKTEIVAHGATATEPSDPSRGEYVFVGWFYMDGETEKAFDFSMPVNRDLDLYAKWSSNKLMEYTIHYELADGTKIAEDTAGSALAGTTKTFEAKTGEDLYENYQSGYFPNTNSHSLTIDIDDPTKNEFTFVYVPKAKLPYKVMYLEFDGDYVYDGTETVLHGEKNAATSNAVITEIFKPLTGYMPDAYQKRLILSADESQNVIIFWYVVDKEHAPVQIIHYVQNAVGDGYTEYQSSTDLNGVINQPYSENILNITGYDYHHATANDEAVTADDGKVTGTVTENGLILELFYNREMHPYEFKFLEQGTGEALADSVTGTARYGSQVTQKAKDIPGYELVSDDPQAIKIQIEDSDKAEKNVRIFYYTVKDAEIIYKVEGPDGCGTVDLNDGDQTGALAQTSETLRMPDGVAKGATAAAGDAFRFIGWFDVAGNKVSEDMNFVPTKADKDMWPESSTYIARFEHNVTSFTITKEANDLFESDDRFVFDVVNSDGSIKFSVTLSNNQTVTVNNVTVGDTYTVTERTAWSWRYGCTDEAQELTMNPVGNAFEFNNTLPSINYWLSGSGVERNDFASNGNT